MPEEVSRIQFGVEPVEALGILQSCNESDAAEVAEARNEKGQVIEQRAYSVSEERQYELLVEVGKSAPKKGEILTDGTWKGIVTAVQRNSTNTEYRKFSVTASRKDAAKLVPYTETT